MFKRLFSWLSGLSSTELREEIKIREENGQTGQTNSTLRELNHEQTNRVSDDKIVPLINERAAEGKNIVKLVAAANERGVLNSSSMSDAALSQVIKERNAQGHTGATDSITHWANVAQTDRLSTSQIDSLIQSRRAAGEETGKLEAARRARG
jgi:hypothetical protein